MDLFLISYFSQATLEVYKINFTSYFKCYYSIHKYNTQKQSETATLQSHLKIQKTFIKHKNIFKVAYCFDAQTMIILCIKLPIIPDD